jgi:hypothetical protein
VPDGAVVTRWETDRSLHELIVRKANGAARDIVRGYVGYEEWPGKPMTRRQVARPGTALILAFGDRLAVRRDPEKHRWWFSTPLAY